MYNGPRAAKTLIRPCQRRHGRGALLFELFFWWTRTCMERVVSYAFGVWGPGFPSIRSPNTLGSFDGTRTFYLHVTRETRKTAAYESIPRYTRLRGDREECTSRFLSSLRLSVWKIMLYLGQWRPMTGAGRKKSVGLTKSTSLFCAGAMGWWFVRIPKTWSWSWWKLDVLTIFMFSLGEIQRKTNENVDGPQTVLENGYLPKPSPRVKNNKSATAKGTEKKNPKHVRNDGDDAA